MRVLAMTLATASAIACSGGEQPPVTRATGPAEPAAEIPAEPTVELDLDSLPAPARSTELLHRAEAAAAAGRWQEAAQLYAATWEHEAPVDTFFSTLERSRNEAMAAAARHEPIKERIYLEMLRERVRRLAACPEPFPDDLPGEYLVHHLLTVGEAGSPEQELAAADPWRVAIELWAVRRRDVALAPDRAAALAVARYQERPDLWTEAATGQLWLLAAEADLREAAADWPEMIRPAWRHAPADSGLLVVELRQWGGGLPEALAGTTGLSIDDGPASPGWTGRPVPQQLPPGPHLIRFLQGHLHSEKIEVEIEPGSCSALILVAIAGV